MYTFLILKNTPFHYNVKIISTIRQTDRQADKREKAGRQTRENRQTDKRVRSAIQADIRQTDRQIDNRERLDRQETEGNTYRKAREREIRLIGWLRQERQGSENNPARHIRKKDQTDRHSGRQPKERDHTDRQTEKKERSKKENWCLLVYNHRWQTRGCQLERYADKMRAILPKNGSLNTTIKIQYILIGAK